MTTLTSNATPIFAVRMDDGRVEQYEMMQACLHFRVPVTLALNSATVGTSASKLTWDQIKEMKGKFNAAGVPFGVCQHFNRNITPEQPTSIREWTTELSKTTLLNQLGSVQRTIVTPGDRTATVNQHGYFIEELARDLGYEYWDGMPSPGGPTPRWSPHLAEVNAYNTGFGGAQIMPGFVDLAYGMAVPSGQTMDLGNFVVERDMSSYRDGLPAAVKALPSNVASYDLVTAGQNDTPPEADWGRSARVFIDAHIANGMGAVLAFHDEISGPGVSNPTGGYDTGDDYEKGMCMAHIAWLLRQYEDAGYCRLGLVDDVNDWGASQFAPNTFLTPEVPTVPSWEVGDTIGIQTGWLAGWGAYGSAGGAQNIGVSSPVDWTELNNYQIDPAGAKTPSNYVGKSVIGYLGKPGAVQMDVTNLNVRFGRVALPEGRYSLIVTNSDYKLENKQFQLIYARARYDIYDAQAAQATKFAWEVQTNQLIGSGQSNNSPQFALTTDSTWEIPFNVSTDCFVQPVEPTEKTDWAQGLHYFPRVYGGIFYNLGTSRAGNVNIRLLYRGPNR